MGSQRWLVLVLGALLLAGVSAAALRPDPRTAPSPSPQVKETLPEMLAGVLLLEVEPEKAVDPEQARLLLEQVPLARQALSPKTKDAANLQGLLVAYILQTLRPEQVELIRSQRALLEIYLPRSPTANDMPALLDSVETLLARKVGAPAPVATRSPAGTPPPEESGPAPEAPASPSPGGEGTLPEAHGSPPPEGEETRLLDLCRGLLALALQPMKEPQAQELARLAPDLRKALQGVPPEQGGVDPRDVARRVRKALEAEQWEQVRSAHVSVVDGTGKPVSDDQLVAELERLLQARAQGKPARPAYKVRRAEPGTVGSGSEAFSGLFFQRLLPGVAALPPEGPLALTGPQKARLRELLPDLEGAVATMASDPRSAPVARAEYQLKQVLTVEQLTHLDSSARPVAADRLKAALADLRKTVDAD